MALNENMSMGDEISIVLTPMPKVYCGSCREHIYYVGNKIKEICPLCGNYFYMMTEDGPVIKTDGGLKPWKITK